MIRYLINPVTYIIKCIFIGAIIYEYYALSFVIISTCHCMKSVLTCSIPDLKIYHFVPNFYVFVAPIDTDSGDVM